MTLAIVPRIAATVTTTIAAAITTIAAAITVIGFGRWSGGAKKQQREAIAG